MNAEASTPPEPITQVASPEQLAAARQARGWSMSDVAAKLGMMPRQIEAIEQGRWEALPGHAFVRGAIRAYGKALQIDVAPLLATLGPQTRPELKPSSSLDSPLPRHGALGFDNGGSGSRIVWIVLGVIGVIAIAMYFGRGADFGQVLEPGSGSTQPGRAVDAVPVAPGAGSGSGASEATQGGAGEATRGGAADATRGGASEGTRGGAAEATRGGAAEATRGGASAGSGGPGASGSNGGPAAGAAAGAGASTASPASAPGGATAAGSGTTPTASRTAASATTSAAPTTPGAAGASGTPSTAVGADAQTGSAASPASGAASSPGAAAQGGPGAAAAGSANQSAGPTADSVVLRFERESWVDVRDATGRVLLMGTQPANSTRELSGQKPYSMTIGNATFVRVEHGGRNVDLGAVTQKGVARVRVE